jgi:hypothetical protein
MVSDICSSLSKPIGRCCGHCGWRVHDTAGREVLVLLQRHGRSFQRWDFFGVPFLGKLALRCFEMVWLVWLKYRDNWDNPNLWQVNGAHESKGIRSCARCTMWKFILFMSFSRVRNLETFYSNIYIRLFRIMFDMFDYVCMFSMQGSCSVVLGISEVGAFFPISLHQKMAPTWKTWWSSWVALEW